jgi:hypothetical protein
MQIILGLIFVIVSAGMVLIGRPKAGQDSAIWLSKPWILGQVYILVALVAAVIGVGFIINAWPS